ncbi:MAG TPA: hypothetical protein VIL86_11630 [Tepidisphaeraceae bacterium]|jgi:hypothetical protein
MPPSPQILPYATPVSAAAKPRLIWLGLHLPGLVALFLPFAYGVSVFDAMHEAARILTQWDWGHADLEITAFAFPFCLSVPLLLLAVSLTFGRLRLAAISFAAILAAITFIANLGTLCMFLGNQTAEILKFLTLPAAILLLGAGVLVFAAVYRRNSLQSLLAILLACLYCSNASLCFIGFADRAESGYYLSLAACAAYTADVILRIRASSS